MQIPPRRSPGAPVLVVFDFDGTLVDSDEALLSPFEQLGVDRREVIMGSAVAEECERLGVSMEAYVASYDVQAVRPFPGVQDMLEVVGRWAIVSNKHPRSAGAELDRLGWQPESVLCADAFGWAHKSLRPLLLRVGLTSEEVVLVGDSEGDLRCAEEVGCRFIWAGWNPRVARAGPMGEIAATPSELLGLLGR
jgi:HAD superfamily hydrolase (TIGR01549 family)